LSNTNQQVANAKLELLAFAGAHETLAHRNAKRCLMTTIEKQIRSLEKLDDVILRDEHRLAETSAQLRQKRADAITARESLALDVLRDSGVLELPPGEIVDLLSSLKVPSEAEHAGIPSAPPDASTAKAEKATERAKIPRPAMAAKECHGSRGSQPASDTGGAVHVVVKISRNVAAEKERVLKRARMRWSGKAGHWHGEVSAEVAERLRTSFAERVTVQSAVTKRPSRGHGSAAADPDAVAIAVGMTATPGEPMPAPTGPAGASGPAAAPPTEPAAASPGSAGADGRGTAQHPTGDIPAASAPVEEPPAVPAPAVAPGQGSLGT
jgi:hypothetical protein